MLKKAGVIAAAAAGLLMLGGPAFAGQGHHVRGINEAHHGQVGLVNINNVPILNDWNLNLILGACGNNVGVLGAAVPVFSPQITHSCAGGGIEG